MKLIVGMGNPGPQYARTRHNAGFMVVDRLAAKHAAGQTPRGRFHGVCVEAEVAGEKCLLLKPTTFMNLAGQAVAEPVNFYKIDPTKDLLVVIDDIYLPVGAVRIKPGGGTGGHNGLESIQRALGGDFYPRLRVGAGLRPSGGKPPFIDQADYVLSRFSEDEQQDLELGLGKSVEAVETFVSKGLAAAMNRFNARVPSPRDKGTDSPAGEQQN